MTKWCDIKPFSKDKYQAEIRSQKVTYSTWDLIVTKCALHSKKGCLPRSEIIIDNFYVLNYETNTYKKYTQTVDHMQSTSVHFVACLYDKYFMKFKSAVNFHAELFLQLQHYWK